MKLLRKRDIPEEGYSNAFLGYGPEESNFSLELTYSKLSEYSTSCSIKFVLISYFLVKTLSEGFNASLKLFISSISLYLICLQSFVADYGVNKYDIGTGFGHFGVAVEDVS